MPLGIFVETDKLILKYTKKWKEPRIEKQLRNRRTKLEDLHHSILRLTVKLLDYCLVIKTVQYSHKDRYIEQNRVIK